MPLRPSALKARLIRAHSLEEARALLESTGSDPKGVDIMAPKCLHACISLEGIPLRAALLLKQEMLSKGGDCAVSRKVAALTCEASDVVLTGTLRQLDHIAESLATQPFGLRAVGREIGRLLAFSAAASTQGVIALRRAAGPLGLGREFGAYIELADGGAWNAADSVHECLVWARGNTEDLLALPDSPGTVWLMEGASCSHWRPLWEALEHRLSPDRGTSVLVLDEGAALQALDGGVPHGSLCIGLTSPQAMHPSRQAILRALGLGLRVAVRVPRQAGGPCAAAALGSAAISAGSWVVFMEDAEAGIGLHHALLNP